MSSINKESLKDLIKESLREVLLQQDIIKSIVSEAVKTAIVAVLSEAKIVKTSEEEIKPQKVVNKKRQSYSDDTALFGESLKNQFNNEFANDFKEKEDPMKKLLTEKFGNKKTIPLDDVADEEVVDEDPEMLRLLGLKK